MFYSFDRVVCVVKLFYNIRVHFVLKTTFCQFFFAPYVKVETVIQSLFPCSINLSTMSCQERSTKISIRSYSKKQEKHVNWSRQMEMFLIYYCTDLTIQSCSIESKKSSRLELNLLNPQLDYFQVLQDAACGIMIYIDSILTC